MPFDRRHVLAQWGGTCPGGEIWSNSLRLAGDDTGDSAHVPTQGELIDWLEGPAKDAVSAFHQAPGTSVHPNCLLTFLKMNVVGTDGRYIEAVTHEYVYPTPLPGGGSGQMHPTQVALAISLTTGLSRGPAHRGRFYLPMPVMLVSTADGRIAGATAALCAAAAANFIVALADEPGLDTGGGMRVCVMSRKTGAAATHVVTGVEVGRVLDTQRRRRNALDEDYQHVVVDQGST